MAPFYLHYLHSYPKCKKDVKQALFFHRLFSENMLVHSILKQKILYR